MIPAVSIAFRSPLQTICVVPASDPAFASVCVRVLPSSLKPYDGTGTAGSMLTCGWIR
jgi:hypothetical protein